jgi:predicted DNA-binding transcriptional regulator AlpA
MLPEILRKSAFLRERDLTSLLSISSSTLYRWVARGDFPAPIRLSQAVTAWSSEQVADWLAQKQVEGAATGGEEF